MEVITIKNSVREVQVAEIVKMYSDGLRTGQISKEINISKRTLETKIRQIKASYDVKTVSQLVALFIRNKIIE